MSKIKTKSTTKFKTKMIVVAMLAMVMQAQQTQTQVYIIEGENVRSDSSITSTIAHVDLRQDHVMAKLSTIEVEQLKGKGYVVFPAAKELIEGRRAIACKHGGRTGSNRDRGVGITNKVNDKNQLSPLVSNWNSVAGQPLSLSYTWGNMQPTYGYSPIINKNMVLQAMYEWSKYIVFSFVEGTSSTDARNMHFNIGTTFGTGVLFSNELAVGYYPPPVAMEPYAGDISFNIGYNWTTDQGFDFQTVALHELGHGAIGLDHDIDTTSIMYPYYFGVRHTLGMGDIVAARLQYATQYVTPPPPPSTCGDRACRDGETPFMVQLQYSSVTQIEFAVINGTITGGLAPYTVLWTNTTTGQSNLLNTGSSTVFGFTTNLNPGTNSIHVSVNSSDGQISNQTISISRNASGTCEGRDCRASLYPKR